MKICAIHFHTTGVQNSSEILRVGLRTFNLAGDESSTVEEWDLPMQAAIGAEDLPKSEQEALYAKLYSENKAAMDYCGYRPGNLRVRESTPQEVINQYLHDGYVPALYKDFGFRFFCKLMGYTEEDMVNYVDIGEVINCGEHVKGALPKIAAAYDLPYAVNDVLSQVSFFESLMRRIGVQTHTLLTQSPTAQPQ